MNDFLEKFVEIIDAEEENISADTLLSDIEEWDSLAYISFIAFARTDYSAKVTASEIRNAKTVSDLYNLVKD